MKNGISIFIIFLIVTGICVWDAIYVKDTIDYVHTETTAIYEYVVYNDISPAENYEYIRDKVVKLEKYWENKVNIMCLLVSRKDMQPVEDYLEYLRSAIILKSQEDCITYARLLHTNVRTLDKITEFRWDNIF